MNDDTLLRIAAALERMAPPPGCVTDWTASPAYVWNAAVRPIDAITAAPLTLLCGIDKQKETVTRNVHRLAAGMAAHDMLLWGARGMGKSALLRAAVKEAQAGGGNIALVQAGLTGVEAMADLFQQLAAVPRNFLVFIDDLGFTPGDTSTPRHLRSWLDGGVEARPGNVRIAVTANRRAILDRDASTQDNPINPRDAIDDQLALADRFGLSVGFHACDQADYLAIVRGYAAHYGIDADEAEALEWAKRRGARSGRIAWHFITEMSGRAGKALPQ